MPSLRIPGYGLTTPGPIVIGTDPGGAELLRVGGAVRVGGTSGTVQLRVIGDGTGDRLRVAALAAASGISIESINAAENSLRPITLLGSAVIVGTDPGGSESLRCGGSGRFFDRVTIAGGVTIRGAQNYIGGAADIAVSGSVANLGTLAIGDAASMGIALVVSPESGHTAIVALFASAHSTTIATAVNGTWGVASGAGNNHNVYWDGGSSTYRIENRSGAPASYYVYRIGRFTTQ